WHWQMSRRKILLSVQAHHRLVSQCSVRVERLYLETTGDGASFRASALAVKGRQRLLKHKTFSRPLTASATPPPARTLKHGKSGWRPRSASAVGYVAFSLKPRVRF